MKVIDKLKLNKFVAVSVPRNRDLYERVGGRVPQLSTGGFTASFGEDKFSQLQNADDSLTKEMLDKDKSA